MPGNNSLRCEDCSVLVEGTDLEAFSDAYLAHARSRHPEWPFPDMAIRNFAEATQRLTGSTERLDSIGTVTIHPVTASRIPDWLAFFDHDVFAGNPRRRRVLHQWATRVRQLARPTIDVRRARVRACGEA